MKPERLTKCVVLSKATSDALDQLASLTGRSISSIADEILGSGVRQMILDAAPPDRGGPFRFGLGSLEGVVVARRQAGGEIQLKRQYSFELLGEGAEDLFALVYVREGDRWRVPTDIESRDLAGVLESGDQLVLTTPAGMRWRITGFLDTIDRRLQPAPRRLVARLRR